MLEYYIMIQVSCPHCHGTVIIEEVNCAIFRHGTLKTGEQVPPHSSKEECDNLVEKKEIYGCGRPFRIRQEGDTWIAEDCGYI